MLGKKLRNRYELFYYLGSGGFGQTYLASDLELSNCTWLVIKQLKPTFNPFHQTDLEKVRQLFDREVEVLRELGNHDRIPSLVDYFTESGESYLVQEFIDGHVFSEELERKPVFSEAQILVFLKDTLEILDFIHSKEFIHRDIKPSNLIRRRQDQKLVFIDFGAVKQISTSKVNDEIGTRIVSDVYTPREQERGKPKFCSDIYSLGIVAIQAFIAAMPSIDEDTNEIMWQEQRTPTISFAQFLDQMVRERPVDRYASANKALEEVDKLINHQYESKIIEQAIKQPTPYKFDYVNYWYREANKLRDLYGYHRLAIYLYNKVIEIHPRFLKAYFNRGVTLRYLNRYEEAVQSFNEAININPQCARAHFQKGIALFLSGFDNYLEALNSYDLAIKHNVFYPVAWFYRGIVLKKLERYEEAVEAYEMAKKQRPGFGRVSFLNEYSLESHP